MITGQQLSETELIDIVIKGNIAVFEILIRRYNSYLYKIGRSHKFNQQEVEELMQETFIHAYENLRKLENKTYFMTWLIKIMMNECYKKTHLASSQKEIVFDTAFFDVHDNSERFEYYRNQCESKIAQDKSDA